MQHTTERNKPQLVLVAVFLDRPRTLRCLDRVRFLVSKISYSRSLVSVCWISSKPTSFARRGREEKKRLVTKERERERERERATVRPFAISALAARRTFR